MIHPIKSIFARRQKWIIKNYNITLYGRRLLAYKNCHKGERCFFIGNGPSLTVEDLNRLHKNREICFAFNRIYNIFDQTDWRPSYYVSQDEKMLQGCQEEVNHAELGVKFIPINLKWYYGINLSHVQWFYIRSPREDNGKPLEFSDDVASCLFNSSTVMYSAAQIAAFMGFEEIYLIGVDHHFRVSQNNHGEIVVDNSVKDYFSEDYNKDKEDLYIPNTEKSTLTYVGMKEQCDQRGISVFNATRGGRLEVFDRVNFDTLFI